MFQCENQNNFDEIWYEHYETEAHSKLVFLLYFLKKAWWLHELLFFHHWHVLVHSHNSTAILCDTKQLYHADCRDNITVLCL